MTILDQFKQELREIKQDMVFIAKPNRRDAHVRELQENAYRASLNDFDRVISVLSSCENEAHVAMAMSYFKVFRNKWYNKISEQVMDYNVAIFEKEKDKLGFLSDGTDIGVYLS